MHPTTSRPAGYSDCTSGISTNVFGNKPGLQLVAANHVADEKVVRPIVTGVRRLARHRRVEFALTIAGSAVAKSR